MKIIKYILPLVALAFIINCNSKPKEKDWEINTNSINAKATILDLGKDFYNSTYPLDSFNAKYVGFLSPDEPNTFYDTRRKDSVEVHLYEESIKGVDLAKLNADFVALFKHIKYYKPNFQEPTIWLYSSLLDGKMPRTLFDDQQKLMAVAIDWFMGKDSKIYAEAKVEPYLRGNMTPENIIPSAAMTFGEYLYPEIFLNSPEYVSPSFLSRIVNEGKKQIILDALLPNTPDNLKIGFSKEDIQWSKENEANIWTYFIEGDLLFSTDNSLSARFLTAGPHSSFYTEVDEKAPARIGAWIGWQICRTYINKNPKVSLDDFLSMSAEDIFKESKYKPSQD